jgi:hypothetical protein
MTSPSMLHSVSVSDSRVLQNPESIHRSFTASVPGIALSAARFPPTGTEMSENASRQQHRFRFVTFQRSHPPPGGFLCLPRMIASHSRRPHTRSLFSSFVEDVICIHHPQVKTLYSYKWKFSYGTKESRTRSAWGRQGELDGSVPRRWSRRSATAIRNSGIVIRALGAGPVG